MSAGPRTIDVATLIEGRRFDRFNYRLIAVSWLITLFDGFDQMMINYTAPYIRDQFGLSKPELGWLVSWGLAGMMAGGFGFSWLADRIGRRPTVVGTAFGFGVLTFATGFAQTYPQLVALRFLDGLAIGGMLPLAWALNIEFAPARMRATVVTVVMLGFSFGSALAGPLTNWLAPAHGWQAVYFAGGVGTLAAAALLLAFLPESARFLVTRGLRPGALARIVGQLDPGLGATAGDRFVLGDEAASRGRFRVGQLFAGSLGTITPFLWAGYIASSLAVYFLASWSPMLLEELRFPRSTAAWMGAINGVVGAIGGLLIMRFTDRRGPGAIAVLPLLAIPTLLLAGSGVVTGSAFLFVQMLNALFLSGGHYGVHSIAGIFYPSAIRASGAGWATSIAKLGAVLGPLLGGYLLASGMPVIRSYTLLTACPVLLALCLFGLARATRDPARSGGAAPAAARA